MSPENVMEPPIQVETQTVSKILDQYGCGPVHFPELTAICMNGTSYSTTLSILNALGKHADRFRL